MSILLITGTSTDVGKTVVTAALAAISVTGDRSVAVVKPAQTGVAPGEPGDLAEVVRLAGPVDTFEFARFPEPLAPDTAARRAGMPLLRRADVVAQIRAVAETHDLTLVEGAGGLLVRLGEDDLTALDLAVELAAPVVVVAAAGLGTLNHSELTVRALHAAGAHCAGLVIGSWPAQPDLASRCNVDDLPSVTGVPLVGSVPEGSGRLSHSEFTTAAPDWFDKTWAVRHLLAG